METRANAEALVSASSRRLRSGKQDRKRRVMTCSLRGADVIGKGLFVEAVVLFRGFGG